MNALVSFLVTMCLCLFVVVEFSFFGGSATRIKGGGDAADWYSITGGEALLKMKRSKGIRIKNSKRRIERMEERSSEGCFFFFFFFFFFGDG